MRILIPAAAVFFVVLHTQTILFGGKTVEIDFNFTSARYGLVHNPAIGQSSSIPPDTMGTVGPNHIVQIVNGLYSVFDKTPGIGGIPIVRGAKTLDQFWIDAGVVPEGSATKSTKSFDPRIIYDPYTDRFFAAAVDNSHQYLGHVLVAVSNSSDPAKQWTGWAFESAAPTPGGEGTWADFPMLGANGDAIVIGANLWSCLLQCRSQDFEGTQVFAFDKEALIAAAAAGTIPPAMEDVDWGASTTGPFPHPVFDLDNGPLPASLWSGQYQKTVRSDLTSSGLSSGGSVSLLPCLIPPGGEQPNTPTKLSNVGRSLTSLPVEQNANVWGVQVCKDLNNNSSAKMFEVAESTNNKLQEGGVVDSNFDLLFPSISVNKLNDVVMGFTATGPNNFPSSYTAVGETNSSNVTTFGSLIELKEGAGVWTRANGRWGDYSATVVDPIHPFHFWTFQEFAPEDDVWGIQISQIKLGPDKVGDMDFDTDVDLDDVDAYIVALTDAVSYYAEFGAKTFVHGDLDCDGDLDVDDTEFFIALITGTYSGCPSGAGSGSAHHRAVPEPATVVVLILGTVCLGLPCVSRRRII